MLVTIGAFDGFHKGHAKLLSLCRENSHGNDWGVITFEPHPAQRIHGLARRLFTLQERSTIAAMLGIPRIFFVEFSENFRKLQPIEFWRLIHDRFNVDGLVMGSDFHFGLNRQGNSETLCKLAHNDGVNTVIIAPLLDKPVYSSSRVRELVSSGEVESARQILGYPYFMTGNVIHGYGRGHSLNFPTANIDISSRNCITPAEGVYSCAVRIGNSLHAGALSLGSNPTFTEREFRCEVHIPDYNGELYGQELTVMFLTRLRGMRAFHGPEELAQQIAHDVQACSEIFNSQRKNLPSLPSSNNISQIIRLV